MTDVKLKFQTKYLLCWQKTNEDKFNTYVLHIVRKLKLTVFSLWIWWKWRWGLDVNVFSCNSMCNHLASLALSGQLEINLILTRSDENSCFLESKLQCWRFANRKPGTQLYMTLIAQPFTTNRKRIHGYQKFSI